MSLLELMMQAFCSQMAGAARSQAPYEHFQNPSYKPFLKPCKLAVRTIVPEKTSAAIPSEQMPFLITGPRELWQDNGSKS